MGLKKTQVLQTSLISLILTTTFGSSVLATPEKETSDDIRLTKSVPIPFAERGLARKLASRKTVTGSSEEVDPTQVESQFSIQEELSLPSLNPANMESQVRVEPLENSEATPLQSLDHYATVVDLESTDVQAPEQITTEPQVAVETLENSEATPETATASSPSVVELENQESSNTKEQLSDAMAQITSVDQLSDVQPTDWAFQALRSLSERYNCLPGYPDGTFRGNNAITRYEFASGLKECLDRIQELIAASGADGVSQADLIQLEKLQENFAAELANIRGRVLALEARTANLEAQQFSTTTKLSGQVIYYVADAFGRNASDANETVYQYRTRISFDTSFTGKDNLKVRLNAGNVPRFNAATDFPRALRGSTGETILLFGSSNGDVDLQKLSYSFPINDQLKVGIDAFSGDRILSDLITPIASLSTGPVSNYGRLNPLLYPIFLQVAAGVQWNPTPWFDLDVSWGSETGSSNDPSLGRGLFNGGYGISTRGVFRFDKLRFALSYIYSYSPENGVNSASGSNASKVTGAGPVAGNTYLGAIFYRFSPKFDLGASAAFVNARTLGKGTRGDAHVINYRANLIFPDLFKEGNIAGVIVGIQPRLNFTSNDSLARAIGLSPGQSNDRDTGWHLEAFYTYRVNDYITITPGVFWLTAPNHDERNPDVVIGAIRTTFNF